MIVKQNYLREKIIDSGYDPNEFMNYLIGINGENATDINNYTLEDLKQVNFFIIIFVFFLVCRFIYKIKK